MTEQRKDRFPYENLVKIRGRLGAKPEVKDVRGQSVADLRVAVSERRKKGDKWTDHTEWIPVTVWGDRADQCAKWLDKGSKVAIEGRYRTREYTDRDGNQRQRTQVFSTNIAFLDDPGVMMRRTRDPSVHVDSHQNQKSGSAPSSDGDWMGDDDLPF